MKEEVTLHKKFTIWKVDGVVRRSSKPLKLEDALEYFNANTIIGVE